MSYQELDAYVAAQIAQGLDAQTIKRVLLETGWLEPDVDNALRDVMAGAVPVAAVSLRDDVVRMRHAVNDLEKRVRNLEVHLVGAPAIALPGGIADVGHLLPSPAWRARRLFLWLGLAVLFVLIGYAGMASLAQSTITPVSRLWAEIVIGIMLTSAGFVFGRMGKRSAANLLTGTGLAFGALATVGAWYLNYLEWSVALAIGALLVTLALVLGRFYDVWVMRGPMTRAA